MFRASRPLFLFAPRASSTSSATRTPPGTSSLASRPRLSLHPRGFPAARFASGSSNPPPPKQPIDHRHEQKVAQETIKPRPDEVSSESSVRHVMEGFSTPRQSEAKLQEGLKHDIGIIKDTFRLSDVPRESHILGLAGTVPYMATSLSTVFLAWDLTKNVPTGNSFYDLILVNHETARHLLSVIEPLQLGYGAVIISFLGAIHWGLEYAEKTPSPERTRFRYGMGVAASVVAWPTLFMPLEYALTTQLMAFVALYFADSRATTRGWTPHWYGTYRLLLTAMVGIAIMVSLVGRATISEHHKLTSEGMRANISQPGLADTKTDWSKLEAEEKKKLKKEKEEAEKKAKKEEQAKKKAEKENGSKGSEKDINKQQGDKKQDGKPQKDEGSENTGEKSGGKNEEKESEKKDVKEADDKKGGKQQNHEKSSGKQDDDKDDDDETNDEKDVEKDDEKDADKDDEKDAEKGDEKDAEKGDEKNAKKDDKKNAEKDDKKDAEKDDKKDAKKDDKKDAEKDDEKNAEKDDKKNAEKDEKQQQDKKGSGDKDGKKDGKKDDKKDDQREDQGGKDTGDKKGK